MPFEEDETPQDGHMNRNDEGGPYSSDNIFRCHVSCDAACDSDLLIIYDPTGNGVYLKRNCKSFTPHRKQLAEMSESNMKARWVWVKKRLAQQHLSDKDFSAYLVNIKGYMYKLY
jgi:hypothetical protein